MGLRYATGRLGYKKAAASVVATTDPTDILGCKIWLDFSDASTLFTDAGTTNVSADADLIYQANDKSGNDYHLTQAEETRRPMYKTGIQNSLSAALSDGSDDHLARTDALGFTGNPAYTLFAVGKAATGNKTYPVILMFGDDASVAGAVIWHTQEIAYRFANGNCVFSDNYNSTALGCFMRESGATYAESKLYYNGSEKTATGSGNGTYTPNVQNELLSVFGIYGVGTSMSGMYIMEIIIYDSALSDADRQSVETYLNNKWAIY